MRDRRILRLFLASPSDVSHERQVVAGVISELNSTVARHLGVLVEVVRWEDMVPGLGRPQQIILDQADLEAVDMFVGILWNRFGTPTGKAASGTEEEFQVARELCRTTGKPRVMLYFCQRPTNFTSSDQLDQKSRLLGFRALAGSIGLVREFNEVRDLENVVRQDVTNHLFAVTRPAVDPSASQGGRATVPDLSTPPEGMVRIPKGPFIRGRGRQSAVIENDFWIDPYPVTNRQYAEFLKATGFMRRTLDVGILQHLERLRKRMEITACGAILADHPVTSITWYEALAYAAWVGKRLPTALEWERAAAGTRGNLYPWGNEFDPTRCNCVESAPGTTTTAVGQYPNGASEDGCYDMAGNVFEWTDDWAINPRFSSAPVSEKVNKGGSYAREASDLVNWYEESDPPDLRMADVGFRCAWSPGAASNKGIQADAQRTRAADA